jgi:hypothetical protein
MVVRTGGKWMFMWRAVDQEGEVLDVPVQKWRNKAAALKTAERRVRCGRMNLGEGTFAAWKSYPDKPAPSHFASSVP